MHPNHHFVTVVQADRVHQAEKARAARTQRADQPAHVALKAQRGLWARVARVGFAR